jgi:hypothetical protein
MGKLTVKSFRSSMKDQKKQKTKEKVRGERGREWEGVGEGEIGRLGSFGNCWDGI